MGTLLRVHQIFKANLPYTCAKSVTQQLYCMQCTGVPFYNGNTGVYLATSLFSLSWYKDVLLASRCVAAVQGYLEELFCLVALVSNGYWSAIKSCPYFYDLSCLIPGVWGLVHPTVGIVKQHQGRTCSHNWCSEQGSGVSTPNTSAPLKIYYTVYGI